MASPNRRPVSSPINRIVGLFLLSGFAIGTLAGIVVHAVALGSFLGTLSGVVLGLSFVWMNRLANVPDSE